MLNIPFFWTLADYQQSIDSSGIHHAIASVKGASLHQSPGSYDTLCVPSKPKSYLMNTAIAVTPAATH